MLSLLSHIVYCVCVCLREECLRRRKTRPTLKDQIEKKQIGGIEPKKKIILLSQNLETFLYGFWESVGARPYPPYALRPQKNTNVS